MIPALKLVVLALLAPFLLAVGVATASPAAAHSGTVSAITPYTYGGVGYAVGKARHDNGVLVSLKCQSQKYARAWWGGMTWQTVTEDWASGYGYAKAEARFSIVAGVSYRTLCAAVVHGSGSGAVSGSIRLA